MNKLFAQLFGRFRLWQKFAILGLITTVLAVLPFTVYFNETQRNIESAQHRAAGVAPLKAMFHLVQVSQPHRGWASLWLKGEDVEADRVANEKAIDEAVAAMDAIVKLEVKDADIAKQWATVTQRWQTLEKQVINRQIEDKLSFKEHTSLTDAYLDVLEKITDYFDMASETGATDLLLQTALDGIPVTTEALDKLRGEGRVLLQLKQASATDKTKVSEHIEIADSQLENRIQKPLNKAFAQSPAIKAKLEPLLAGAVDKYRAAIKLAQTEIVNAPALTYPNQDYRFAYLGLSDTLQNLAQASLDVAGGIMNKQVAELRQQQLTLSFAILGLFVLGSIVAFYVSRGVTGPVSHLVGVMNQLAAGGESVRANIETEDEIGVLGRQFDRMVDQREAVSLSVRQENEEVNNSVIELLQAVAKLAQKDLTIKVPMAQDITGPVADALNLLTQETASVLSRVVDIANKVATISQDVKSQSDTVIVVATEEMREVEQAAAELSLASEVMQEIAKLALACNQAAEQAIHNTDKAQETVLGTVEGITSIRDTIRETEKRIKRLGERSQEIGSIVNLINGISERTHILAVNAAMHAASAGGDAGRGFAVIANGVQKLAESAREATMKITDLVNDIQTETAETVTTMNDAISQVVRGTTLAQQAGSEMRQTRDTTANLVQLVRRIADSSSAQAHTSLQLRERALQIQQSTEHTYGQLQAQGIQTDRLVGYSEDLVKSVGVFTLPKSAQA